MHKTTTPDTQTATILLTKTHLSPTASCCPLSYLIFTFIILYYVVVFLHRHIGKNDKKLAHLQLAFIRGASIGSTDSLVIFYVQHGDLYI